MSSPHDSAVVAYVPAPHDGYVRFFRKYHDRVLYILGADFIEEFPSIARNVAGNDPGDAQRMIQALGIFPDVRILTKDTAHELERFVRVVLPDEDVSRAIVERYLAGRPVEFDGSWKLRWHKDAVQAPSVPDTTHTVSTNELDRVLMGSARTASERSPDWWRQVGAVLVRDGKPLITAYNTHLPTEQSAYVLGDPRSNFDAGQNIDATLALHAEVGVLAEAARRGISTEGCDLYVTTFPCPPCAHAVAASGIKRLFFSDGYSLIAGAEALQSRGVELIRVLQD